MSELSAAPAATLNARKGADHTREDEVAAPSVALSPSQALITEQEVVFATAAAGRSRRTKTRNRRNFTGRSDRYLEHSRMQREMYRL